MALKKILIVDDDIALRDAVEMMLEPSRYKVDGIRNADPLFNMKSDLPDLILLDYFLPGKNGHEVCRRLKQNGTTRTIPVVLISAKEDLPAVAADAGADDYLVKPFQMMELLDKINSIIR